MSDFAVAGMILVFLVGLAVVAPIWGVDSRDGIESDQSARRVAWLQGAQHGPLLGKAQAGVSGNTVGVAMAGVLRSVAHRVDSTADATGDLDRQVVAA